MSVCSRAISHAGSRGAKVVIESAGGYSSTGGGSGTGSGALVVASGAGALHDTPSRGSSGDGGAGAAGSAAVSASRSAGAQSVDAPTHQMRFRIQHAIDEMQQELKDELQEDQLKIHGVLGQGAFGTVYHGAASSCMGRAPPGAPAPKQAYAV